MAKFPNPGKVNKQFIPNFGEEDSSGFYSAFVKDLVANHSQQQYRFTVYLQPFDLGEQFLHRFGSVKLRPMSGVTQEDIYLNCFDETCALYDKVIIIQPFVPYLRVSDISEAFESLDMYDAVLGPTNSSSVYLIGLKRCSKIFKSAVLPPEKGFKALEKDIKAMNLSLAVSKTLQAIETIEDVIGLSKTLDQTLSPNTAGFISELSEKYKSVFQS